MRGVWTNHRYGTGESLDLGLGSGSVEWTDGQFRARTCGRTKMFKQDEFTEAKKWVEDVLRAALRDALALLVKLENK